MWSRHKASEGRERWHSAACWPPCNEFPGSNNRLLVPKHSRAPWQGQAQLCAQPHISVPHPHTGLISVLAPLCVTQPHTAGWSVQRAAWLWTNPDSTALITVASCLPAGFQHHLLQLVGRWNPSTCPLVGWNPAQRRLSVALPLVSGCCHSSLNFQSLPFKSCLQVDGSCHHIGSFQHPQPRWCPQGNQKGSKELLCSGRPASPS